MGRTEPDDLITEQVRAVNRRHADSFQADAALAAQFSGILTEAFKNWPERERTDGKVKVIISLIIMILKSEENHSPGSSAAYIDYIQRVTSMMLCPLGAKTEEKPAFKPAPAKNPGLLQRLFLKQKQ